MKSKKMATDVSIGIVLSLFNDEVTHPLLKGTLQRLEELGIEKKNIHVVKVPGAVEIPLTAKMLAKSKRFQALICLGAVIRGETSHFDYVCSQVSAGCQQVMMEYELPVIFGVLTTENVEQARDRVGGRAGHKGREAAEAALHMIIVMQNLKKVKL